MRKIVAGLFISLDGVIEAPDQWHFPYFNDEMGAGGRGPDGRGGHHAAGAADLRGVRRLLARTRAATWSWRTT